MHKKSFSVQATLLAPDLKISSAAIYYDEIWGDRYQYETWIFSKNPSISSRQVIHGNSSGPSQGLKNKARKYHRRVFKILKGLTQ